MEDGAAIVQKLALLVKRARAAHIGKHRIDADAVIPWVRNFLKYSDTQVRCAALRALRYIIQYDYDVERLWQEDVDLYFARSLEQDARHLNERLESFKLLKCIMDISISHLRRPILKALAAIAQYPRDPLCPTAVVLLQQTLDRAITAISLAGTHTSSSSGSEYGRRERNSTFLSSPTTSSLHHSSVQSEGDNDEELHAEGERMLALLSRCGGVEALINVVFEDYIPLDVVHTIVQSLTAASSSAIGRKYVNLQSLVHRLVATFTGELPMRPPPDPDKRVKPEEQKKPKPGLVSAARRAQWRRARRIIVMLSRTWPGMICLLSAPRGLAALIMLLRVPASGLRLLSVIQLLWQLLHPPTESATNALQYHWDMLLTESHSKALETAVNRAKALLEGYESRKEEGAGGRDDGASPYGKLGIPGATGQTEGVIQLPLLLSDTRRAANEWATHAGGAAPRSTIKKHYSDDFEDEWGGVWTPILSAMSDTRSGAMPSPWGPTSADVRPAWDEMHAANIKDVWNPATAAGGGMCVSGAAHSDQQTAAASTAGTLPRFPAAGTGSYRGRWETNAGASGSLTVGDMVESYVAVLLCGLLQWGLVPSLAFLCTHEQRPVASAACMFLNDVTSMATRLLPESLLPSALSLPLLLSLSSFAISRNPLPKLPMHVRGEGTKRITPVFTKAKQKVWSMEGLGGRLSDGPASWGGERVFESQLQSRAQLLATIRQYLLLETQGQSQEGMWREAGGNTSPVLTSPIHRQGPASPTSPTRCSAERGSGGLLGRGVQIEGFGVFANSAIEDLPSVANLLQHMPQTDGAGDVNVAAVLASLPYAARARALRSLEEELLEEEYDERGLGHDALSSVVLPRKAIKKSGLGRRVSPVGPISGEGEASIRAAGAQTSAGDVFVGEFDVSLLHMQGPIADGRVLVGSSEWGVHEGGKFAATGLPTGEAHRSITAPESDPWVVWYGGPAADHGSGPKVRRWEKGTVDPGSASFVVGKLRRDGVERAASRAVSVLGTLTGLKRRLGPGEAIRTSGSLWLSVGLHGIGYNDDWVGLGSIKGWGGWHGKKRVGSQLHAWFAGPGHIDQRFGAGIGRQQGSFHEQLTMKRAAVEASGEFDVDWHGVMYSPVALTTTQSQGHALSELPATNILHAVLASMRMFRYRTTPADHDTMEARRESPVATEAEELWTMRLQGDQAFISLCAEAEEEIESSNVLSSLGSPVKVSVVEKKRRGSGRVFSGVGTLLGKQPTGARPGPPSPEALESPQQPRDWATLPRQRSSSTNSMDSSPLPNEGGKIGPLEPMLGRDMQPRFRFRGSRRESMDTIDTEMETDDDDMDSLFSSSSRTIRNSYPTSPRLDPQSTKSSTSQASQGSDTLSNVSKVKMAGRRQKAFDFEAAAGDDDPRSQIAYSGSTSEALSLYGMNGRSARGSRRPSFDPNDLSWAAAGRMSKRSAIGGAAQHLGGVRSGVAGLWLEEEEDDGIALPVALASKGQDGGGGGSSSLGAVPRGLPGTMEAAGASQLEGSHYEGRRANSLSLNRPPNLQVRMLTDEPGARPATPPRHPGRSRSLSNNAGGPRGDIVPFSAPRSLYPDWNRSDSVETPSVLSERDSPEDDVATPLPSKAELAAQKSQRSLREQSEKRPSGFSKMLQGLFGKRKFQPPKAATPTARPGLNRSATMTERELDTKIEQARTSVRSATTAEQRSKDHGLATVREIGSFDEDSGMPEHGSALFPTGSRSVRSYSDPPVSALSRGRSASADIDRLFGDDQSAVDELFPSAEPQQLTKSESTPGGPAGPQDSQFSSRGLRTPSRRPFHHASFSWGNMKQDTGRAQASFGVWGSASKESNRRTSRSSASTGVGMFTTVPGGAVAATAWEERDKAVMQAREKAIAEGYDANAGPEPDRLDSDVAVYPGITVDALHQGAGPAPVVGLYGEALGVDWSSGWPEVDGLANVVVTLEGGRREVRNERHPAVVGARQGWVCVHGPRGLRWYKIGEPAKSHVDALALMWNDETITDTAVRYELLYNCLKPGSIPSLQTSAALSGDGIAGAKTWRAALSGGVGLFGVWGLWSNGGYPNAAGEVIRRLIARGSGLMPTTLPLTPASLLEKARVRMNNLLRDSQVIGSKDWRTWNWRHVVTLLDYYLPHPTLLMEAMRTKFVRRLSKFFLPDLTASGVLSHAPWSPFGIRFMRIMRQLLLLLIHHPNGRAFLLTHKRGRILHEIVVQLRREVVGDVVPDPRSTRNLRMKPHMFSRSRFHLSFAREYISLLALATSTRPGRQLLRQVLMSLSETAQKEGLSDIAGLAVDLSSANEKTKRKQRRPGTPTEAASPQPLQVSGGALWRYLSDLGSVRYREYLARHLALTLDYDNPGAEGRLLLQMWMASGSQSLRLYLTCMLRSLLRRGVSEFSDWGIEMLVTQLQAEEQLVAENALSVLTEAAESPVYLKAIITRRPVLRRFPFCLSAPLLVRIAGQAEGVLLLHDMRLLVPLMRYWREAGEQYYCFSVFSLLETNLSSSINRQPEFPLPAPSVGSPHAPPAPEMKNDPEAWLQARQRAEVDRRTALLAVLSAQGGINAAFGRPAALPSLSRGSPAWVDYLQRTLLRQPGLNSPNSPTDLTHIPDEGRAILKNGRLLSPEAGLEWLDARVGSIPGAVPQPTRWVGLEPVSSTQHHGRWRAAEALRRRSMAEMKKRQLQAALNQRRSARSASRSTNSRSQGGARPDEISTNNPLLIEVPPTPDTPDGRRSSRSPRLPRPRRQSIGEAWSIEETPLAAEGEVVEREEAKRRLRSERRREREARGDEVGDSDSSSADEGDLIHHDATIDSESSGSESPENDVHIGVDEALPPVSIESCHPQPKPIPLYLPSSDCGSVEEGRASLENLLALPWRIEVWAEWPTDPTAPRDPHGGPEPRIMDRMVCDTYVDLSKYRPERPWWDVNTGYDNLPDAYIVAVPLNGAGISSPATLPPGACLRAALFLGPNPVDWSGNTTFTPPSKPSGGATERKTTEEEPRETRAGSGWQYVPGPCAISPDEDISGEGQAGGNESAGDDRLEIEAQVQESAETVSAPRTPSGTLNAPRIRKSVVHSLSEADFAKVKSGGSSRRGDEASAESTATAAEQQKVQKLSAHARAMTAAAVAGLMPIPSWGGEATAGNDDLLWGAASNLPSSASVAAEAATQAAGGGATTPHSQRTAEASHSQVPKPPQGIDLAAQSWLKDAGIRADMPKPKPGSMWSPPDWLTPAEAAARSKAMWAYCDTGKMFCKDELGALPEDIKIAEAGAHGRVRSASSAARSIRTGSGATKVDLGNARTAGGMPQAQSGTPSSVPAEDQEAEEHSEELAKSWERLTSERTICAPGAHARWRFHTSVLSPGTVRFDRVEFGIQLLPRRRSHRPIQPHLFGELACTRVGCDSLSLAHVPEACANTAFDSRKPPLARQAALWSMGHMGASEGGYALLLDSMPHLPRRLDNIARTDSCLDTRGVAIQVIGVLCRTPRGARDFMYLGWRSSRSPFLSVPVSPISIFQVQPLEQLGSTALSETLSTTKKAEVKWKNKLKPEYEPVLQALARLCNRIVLKEARESLLNLKAKSPRLFRDRNLYEIALHYLSEYAYRLNVRRFVYSLFEM